MSITVEELEHLFSRIIQKLKSDDCTEFNFDVNEYLFISSDEWENFDNFPEPIIGSLDDDILSLKQQMSSDEEITYVDIDRISFVLRAISQEMNPI